MITILKAGSLRVRSVGEGPNAVVLCHGFGAPGDDLVPLARELDVPKGTRFLFPEGPLSVDVGLDEPGRAWWPVDMMRLQLELMSGRRSWDPEVVPQGMLEARAALVEALGALVAQHGLDPERTVLGGFSQGAMLTTEIALCRKELGLPFTRLAILSGALVCAARWRAALGADAARLHVFQSHGFGDPILRYDVAESLRDMLLGAGADVRFVRFAGAHELPPVVLRELGTFIRGALGRDGLPAG